MTSWQKRARLGVAVFGVVFAAVVYSAIGERQPVAPAAPIQRMDPKAMLETSAAYLQQIRGGEKDFEIEAAQTQSYADGSTRQADVRITVRNRGGRDYVITAREAYAGADQVDLRLTGDVKLAASDGFQLATADATFNRASGVARAAGTVAFSKGRMSGSGVGMSYDQMHDVLRLESQSKVVTTDENGGTAFDFAAGASTLDRLQHLLSLESGVRVVRPGQVIEADRATARLNETNETVTYMELRGNARVTGGGPSIDSMSARDIDLDYTDDGTTLERVLLNGGGAIAMTAAGAGSGRRLQGDVLDLALASDGSLTRAIGKRAVRLDLPPAGSSPGRSIIAEELDATGAPGRGLTSATFSSDTCGPGVARDRCVTYSEDSAGGGEPRIARSRRLVAMLADDAVTSATFTGTVTFNEQGLEASGAEAAYVPGKGTLRLTGRDAGGAPRVVDDDVTIDGGAIDVSLGTRHMTASGGVKTTLQPRTAAGAAARQQRDETVSRRPGLLKQEEAVNINADRLDYQGASGKAVYTGKALLTQGSTSTIRGQAITIDQESGDLVATGSASSVLEFAGGSSTGLAHEIRYDDERRVIAYSLEPLAPTTGPGAAPAARAAVPAAPRTVRLSSPDGDVTAQRIEVILAQEDSRIDRLEAYTSVSIKVGTRTATGARLTYHAADERYVMSAGPGVPVRIVDGTRADACRETTSQTLIFFKGTDTMIIDGGEFTRTQTKSGGPCGPAPASR